MDDDPYVRSRDVSIVVHDPFVRCRDVLIVVHDLFVRSRDVLIVAHDLYVPTLLVFLGTLSALQEARLVRLAPPPDLGDRPAPVARNPSEELTNPEGNPGP